MLRKTILALCFGLAAAACGQTNDSAVGLVVRADDGTELGRVASIERDVSGRIVSADIPGMEPADAPAASEDLLAEEEDFWVRTSSRAPSAGFRALR